MRKTSLALVLSAATVCAVACSGGRNAGTGDGQSSSTSGGSSGAPDDNAVGALGIQLSLPSGQHFSVLNYSLTNGVYNISGSSNIGTSSALTVVVGSVPAGSGYALSLSTTSDDGAVICAFPAPGDPAVANITITARAATVATVNMQCVSTAGLEAGSLWAQGLTSDCPMWTSIVATPVGSSSSTIVYPSSDASSTSLGVGQSMTLVATATAPDLTQLSFAWTATGGSLSSTTGTVSPTSNDAGDLDQTTFTCPAAVGTVTVSLAVSDGPVPEAGGCDPRYTQGSITVNCQVVPVDAGGGDSSADGASEAAGGGDAGADG